MKTAAPKLLFFVTEDWYFYSHRLPLASAAVKQGYDVALVTRVRDHGKLIASHGIRLIPIELVRGGMNPFNDLSMLWRLIRIYRQERPDIVHHVGMKPILHGTLAARAAGVHAIVNAFAGLGYLYTSEGLLPRLARRLLEVTLRVASRRGTTRVIAQNADDLQRLMSAGVCTPASGVLIRGAGVDLAYFVPQPESGGVPIVALVSRMLWDKGVAEFIAAAKRLRAAGIGARFVLVGDSDKGNRHAVDQAQLQAWNDSGEIEWWGRRENMATVYAECHVICLPTYYGEGIPKVLLEAAASGRAAVTTNIPGCRDVVRDDVSGLLVPPRDIAALTQALTRVITDASLRRRMAVRARQIAEEEYSIERVVGQTLSMYSEVLAQDKKQEI